MAYGTRVVGAMYPCARCGCDFTIRGRAGNPQTYCLPCARLRYRGDRTRMAPCLVCGGILPQRKKMFCGDDCAYQHKSGAARQPRRDCKRCGSICPRRQYYCSSGCRAANESERLNAKNHRRRAAIGNRFTLGDVIRRSGLSCHICHGDVDLSLSGMDPNGPTIDHLIPIARGGPNFLTNTAVAHRICNMKRSTGGAWEQLRLVG